ncbi:thiamine pyrophosphate-binding protein [Polynucleobacter sp. 80A-SIGWE]|uniref:thiamine pyrophosphate-binding protein n=1 Tax=Polynucleobacter sp. 80A-SIGWE TaxID=2689100 RepID=UPI001C0D903D|nr:thiamine pyrophosphate-binding protein [Polynucleobacter sp. 80A-SIGWE]MBU3589783.1 thiamine pyrophosphate-binding protein [Polynucleobacter sp. 80A-SIGWE]
MVTKITSGADNFVKALELAGVTKVFTLSGNHIMPVYNALFDSKIALIHTRHEAAAVHMADAWARLTGEIGIALVTGGPGHANAVSALYTASMAESPVVLVSGHAPLNQLGKGAFQEMAQADIAAPLTKASWTCQKVEDIAIDTAKAIRIAKSGRPGPTHLSLPSDILEAASPLNAPLPSSEDFLVEHQSSNVDVAAILSPLMASKKPLILVGPMMLSKSGRKQLLQLEAALNIPVVGMESPRGIGDPSLGAFSEVLSQADCILLLGKKLDFTLKFGNSPGINPECTLLQIDPEANEIERVKKAVSNRLKSSCICDTPTAIDKLIAAKSAKHPSPDEWLKEVNSAITYRPASWKELPPTAGRIHPAQAFLPLQEILDSHPDSVLVSDGGEIGQWAQACLNAPNRVLNGIAGSIGAGISFALASRVAKPNAPIIAVMGDGTFGFHSAEIDTAVRYGLDFVLLVGNDARWNAEYQIQLKDYGKDRTIGCELLPSSYEKVCQAFGGYGELVTSSNEILPAVKRAIASNLPSCINVMIEGLAAPNIKRG